MPVIKSAIKKLRKDRKREKQNDVIRASIKSAISRAKKDKKPESVREAIVLVDKATKKNILHKNKASRVKSSLTKIALPKGKVSAKAPVVKKAAAKKSTPAKAKK